MTPREAWDNAAEITRGLASAFPSVTIEIARRIEPDHERDPVAFCLILTRQIPREPPGEIFYTVTDYRAGRVAPYDRTKLQLSLIADLQEITLR